MLHLNRENGYQFRMLRMFCEFSQHFESIFRIRAEYELLMIWRTI